MTSALPRFVAALLGERQDEARDLVLPLLDTTSGVRGAFIDVLEPAARELWRRVGTDEITLVKAHLLTMIIQRLIHEATSTVFSVPSHGPSILVASGSPYAGDVTARVVADVLHMDGFDTSFVSPIPEFTDFDSQTPGQIAVVVALTEDAEPSRAIALTLGPTSGRRLQKSMLVATVEEALAAIKEYMEVTDGAPIR